METSSRMQLLLPVILVLGLAGAFLLGVYSIFAGIDLGGIIYDEQLARVLGLRSSSYQSYPQKLPKVREVLPGEIFTLPVDYSVHSDVITSDKFRPLGIDPKGIKSISIPVLAWQQDAASSGGFSSSIEALNPTSIKLNCLQSCDILSQAAVYDVVIINGSDYLAIVDIRIGLHTDQNPPSNQPKAENTIVITWGKSYSENYIVVARI